MAKPESVTRSSKLGPAERASAIEVLKTKELDVLVVGGGIVGTGSALDATTRGLRVGMVEARDWASGTSSRSSKLVHGGIRYLEQLDFRLVREALIERGPGADDAAADHEDVELLRLEDLDRRGALGRAELGGSGDGFELGHGSGS